MSFSDESFWPISHIIVLGLVPVAIIVMMLDATRVIDLEGAGLPIMMVTLTLASIQWDIRRRREGERDLDHG